MRLTHTRLTFAICVLALSLGSFVSGQTVICPKERITGFDSVYDKAVRSLPGKTHDVEGVEIYVDSYDGFIYAHSNFQPEGNPYAIKLATKDTRNLSDIFYSLTEYGFAGDPKTDEALRARILATHTGKAKYIFAQNLLTDAGGLNLELDGASRLYVTIDGEITPRLLVKCKGPRGPPKFAIHLGGNLFVQANPNIKPASLLQSLAAQSFHQQDFVGVNLVIDSATEGFIAKSKFARNYVAPRSLDEIEKVFSTSIGKTMVVVMHVEGDEGVVRDASGTEVLRIELKKLTSLAEKHQVNLVILGCETAGIVPAGVLNKFNSLRAVQQLDMSLASATNHAEFFANLSADDIKLVLPANEQLPAKTLVEIAVVQASESVTEPLEQTGRIFLFVGGGGGSTAGGGATGAGNQSQNGTGNSVDGQSTQLNGATTHPSDSTVDDDKPAWYATRTAQLSAVAIVIGVVAIVFYRAKRRKEG